MLSSALSYYENFHNFPLYIVTVRILKTGLPFSILYSLFRTCPVLNSVSHKAQIQVQSILNLNEND